MVVLADAGIFVGKCLKIGGCMDNKQMQMCPVSFGKRCKNVMYPALKEQVEESAWRLLQHLRSMKVQACFASSLEPCFLDNQIQLLVQMETNQFSCVCADLYFGGPRMVLRDEG